MFGSQVLKFLSGLLDALLYFAAYLAGRRDARSEAANDAAKANRARADDDLLARVHERFRRK